MTRVPDLILCEPLVEWAYAVWQQPEAYSRESRELASRYIRDYGDLYCSELRLRVAGAA